MRQRSTQSAISSIDELSLSTEEQIKEERLKNIDDFKAFLQKTPSFIGLKIALPDSDQKEIYDNFIKELTNLKEAIPAIEDFKQEIAKTDVSSLTKPPTHKILGSHAFISYDLGSQTYTNIGRGELHRKFAQPFDIALRNLGEMVLKELVKMDEMIALAEKHSPTDPKIKELKLRQAELQAYYKVISDYFVSLQSFVSDEYGEALKKTEKIIFLFNQLNNNLEKLKSQAQMRGDEGVIYEELKHAAKRLFLQPVFKDDLKAVQDQYLQTLSALRPEDALRKKMKAFKKSLTHSNAESLIHAEALISEINNLSREFKAELKKCEQMLKKNDPSTHFKELEKLKQAYTKGIQQLNVIGKEIEEAHKLLQKGKQKECQDKVNKLKRSIYPSWGLNDRLVIETGHVIKDLSKEMATLCDTMDQCVKNFGFEMAVPLIQKLAIGIQVLLNPILLDPARNFLENKVESVSSEIFVQRAIAKIMPSPHSDKKPIEVAPPLWCETWVDDVKRYAQSGIGSLTKAGTIFVLCSIFPPATPFIAGIAIFHELVPDFLQKIGEHIKQDKALQDTISILEALANLALSEEKYGKLKSDKQHTLFKLALLLNKELQIDAPSVIKLLATQNANESTSKIATSLNITITRKTEEKYSVSEDNDSKQEIKKEKHSEPQVVADVDIENKKKGQTKTFRMG
ncbi:MAG: hypothetical protein JO131_02515 [Gammaproteobacteria bacterium]|nr:hypothetical protein [Gammaproteobacteria bacterium]